MRPNIAMLFWSLTCHMQECLLLFSYLHVIKSYSPSTESEFIPVVFENAKLQILHLIFNFVSIPLDWAVFCSLIAQ